MIRFNTLFRAAALAGICGGRGGCGEGGLEGYSNDWVYPQDVTTVYVEMFDSQSFRRGHEYVLTDAICKRVESEGRSRDDTQRADGQYPLGCACGRALFRQAAGKRGSDYSKGELEESGDR